MKKAEADDKDVKDAEPTKEASAKEASAKEASAKEASTKEASSKEVSASNKVCLIPCFVYFFNPGCDMSPI